MDGWCPADAVYSGTRACRSRIYGTQIISSNSHPLHSSLMYLPIITYEVVQGASLHIVITTHTHTWPIHVLFFLSFERWPQHALYSYYYYIQNVMERVVCGTCCESKRPRVFHYYYTAWLLLVLLWYFLGAICLAHSLYVLLSSTTTNNQSVW